MDSAEIQRRIREAATGFREGSPGMVTIAIGLDQLADEIALEPDSFSTTELEVLVDLAETFRAIARPTSKRTELNQLFQDEAKKRLAGLSISLMGIFNHDDSAVELSAGHLHAIKGSAAILGLRSVADLANVMEQVVFELGTCGPVARQDALRPMLRAFSVLRSLVDEPTSGSEVVAQIEKDLRSFLFDDPPTVQLEEEFVNAFLDEHATNVQLSVLEKRILVVDDEATIAASVAFVLSDLELPVDIASDGAAALDRLNSKPYSLVISDIGMPHLDGFALLEAMRADLQFADIPVLLLTGRDNPGFRQRAASLGCEDYVIKGSIGGGALRSRVARLLERAPSVPRRDSSDVSHGRVLLCEDRDSVDGSLAFLLSEGRFDLTWVASPSDVFTRVKSGEFDLVIGEDFDPVWLDSFREASQIPVVVVDADDDFETEGILSVSRETLLNTISQWFEP